jgi:N-acetylglucosaminyl-diphospho-decaprenol L-rhamnosyltransferase
MARAVMGGMAGAMTEVAVVTIVRGRLGHLRRQGWGLQQQGLPGLRWVVVRMGGPDVRDVLADLEDGRDDGLPTAGDQGGDQGGDGEQVPLQVRVVDLDVPDGAPLPLAAARNAGIRAAAGGGARTVVLLDVDVVPAPGLVRRYADAVARTGSVVAGPVGYLPPGVPTGRADLARLPDLAQAHPARPVPADGELLAEQRWELLWTLSMALPVTTFERAGGFDERYVGYGGEDTDFAMRLRAAGADLHWVGGAWGFHQHHAESGRHDKVEDIVRNASLFRATWGWWPMSGWLADLQRDGVVVWDPEGTTLRLAGEPA